MSEGENTPCPIHPSSDKIATGRATSSTPDVSRKLEMAANEVFTDPEGFEGIEDVEGSDDAPFNKDGATTKKARDLDAMLQLDNALANMTPEDLDVVKITPHKLSDNRDDLREKRPLRGDVILEERDEDVVVDEGLTEPDIKHFIQTLSYAIRDTPTRSAVESNHRCLALVWDRMLTVERQGMDTDRLLDELLQYAGEDSEGQIIPFVAKRDLEAAAASLTAELTKLYSFCRAMEVRVDVNIRAITPRIMKILDHVQQAHIRITTANGRINMLEERMKSQAEDNAVLAKRVSILESSLERVARVLAHSDQKGRDPPSRSRSAHPPRGNFQAPHITMTKSGGSAYKAVSSDRQLQDQPTSRSKPSMQRLIQRPSADLVGGKHQLGYNQRGGGIGGYPAETQGCTRENQAASLQEGAGVEDYDNPDAMTPEEIALYDAEMREKTGAPRIGMVGGAITRNHGGGERLLRTLGAGAAAPIREDRHGLVAPSGGLPGLRRTARSVQGRGNGLSKRDIDFSYGREDLVPKDSLRKGRETMDKLKAMAQTTVAEIHEYDDQIANDCREKPFRGNPSYASEEYGGGSQEDDQSHYVDGDGFIESWADEVERDIGDPHEPPRKDQKQIRRGEDLGQRLPKHKPGCPCAGCPGGGK